MEVDVLVAGSGCGGLTAAIAAKEFGSKKVLLIEKGNFFGGTSATSGGVIWVPQNMHATNHGAQDSYEDAFKYLQATTPSDEFNTHRSSVPS
jgi:3-oxosteroid 1-dehydrogenase